MSRLVSIIIPVYNSSPYLDELNENLINQTYKNIEIIYVNDNSNDDSYKMITSYRKHDSRIISINLEQNRGPAYARNKGIEISKGEYIVFFDSDDNVELNIIETYIKHLDLFDTELVICGYTVTTFKNSSIVNKSIKTPSIDYNKSSSDIISKLYKDEMLNTLVNKIFKSKIIFDNKIKMNTDLRLSEDFNFVIDYLKQINKISVIEEPLYNVMRQNTKSLTTKYHENMDEIQKFTINNLNDLFNNKGNTEQSDNALKYRVFRSKIIILKNLFHKDDNHTKEEKINIIKEIINNQDEKHNLSNLKEINLKEKIILRLFKMKAVNLIYFLFKIS